MLNSVNKSSSHKVLNPVGRVSEYKTCLGPEYKKSLSFKVESKLPLERMPAGLGPESMKCSASWPTNDVIQQHDAEQMNHNAFQHRKFNGVQPRNQTNKRLDQH